MIDPFLAKLAQQIAFYQAGGKDPGQSDVEKLNQLGQTWTGIGKNAMEIGNNALAQRKAQLDIQKGGQEVSPIGSIFGVSTADQENRANNLARASMAPVQGPPNLVPAPQGTMGPSQMIPPQQPAPLPTDSSREAFQAQYKISPDTPLHAVPEVMKMAALGNAKYLYANPLDFTDVSVSPDATHSYPVPQKQGLDLGTKNPMVSAVSGEQAIKQGQVRKNDKIVTPMAQGISPLADVRATQNIMSDLPSRSGPGTQAGAASTVQFSARQGKQLVANPGSPQRLALSAVDLARTVQRNAPTVDTLTNSGFADNLVTKLELLKQKLTTDPSSADVPKLRKEIYDIFTDLEESSKPIIKRQLDTTESLWKDRLPPDWQKIRSSELGENLEPIPFNDGQPQIMYANNGIQRIQSTDGGQTWSPVK